MPQYHCPRCDGAIAPECVRGEMLEQDSSSLARRIVRVYCPHCSELFEAVCVLVGGLLQPEGQPRVVADRRVRTRMLKEVAKTRGDRQVMAC